MLASEASEDGKQVQGTGESIPEQKNDPEYGRQDDEQDEWTGSACMLCYGGCAQPDGTLRKVEGHPESDGRPCAQGLSAILRRRKQRARRAAGLARISHQEWVE